MKPFFSVHHNHGDETVVVVLQFLILWFFLFCFVEWSQKEKKKVLDSSVTSLDHSLVS